MPIFISTGNTKLGDIANISLPPGKSCMSKVPCIQHCYALKAYRQYPHVRANWDSNLKTYLTDPCGYFEQINKWVHTQYPPYFRWHVSGDIIDKEYIYGVVDTCASNKNTLFMLTTKRYDLVEHLTNEHRVPLNLKIRLSMWPYIDLPTNPCKYPLAWVRGDLRAPTDLFQCTGKCTNCMHCWLTNKDVLFKPH